MINKESESTQERDYQWKRIMDLTTEMRRVADAEEWVEVLKMERARNTLIQEYFSVPANAEEAPTLECGILEILSIDNEIIEVGRASRDKFGCKLSEIKSNRRATAAYIQNSR